MKNTYDGTPWNEFEAFFALARRAQGQFWSVLVGVLGLVLLCGAPAASAQSTEEALLRGTGVEPGDGFGGAVAADGRYALVGARNDAGPSNQQARSGAVYAYERINGTWQQVQTLRAPNAGFGDRFGDAVAMSGHWAVVGAYLEDGALDDQSNAGAAYVFEREASGTWTHVQTLRASDADAFARFGGAVAIDGDRAVVGAPAHSPPDPLQGAGAAYVFQRGTNGAWQETQRLRAGNADAGDRFGSGVAISGRRVLVGATGEAGAANDQEDAGAAYVFEQAGDGSWQQAQLLRAAGADAGDLFGRPVAMDGGRAVVGVPRDEGPQDGTRRAGAVYVFDRSSTGWPRTETAVLHAPQPERGDEFGYSVALSGTRVLAGAIDDDGPSNSQSNAGAAYLYEQTPRGWQAAGAAPFRASNAGEGDLLGYGVALSGPQAVVTALNEEGPSDQSGRVGAVYVFGKRGLPTATLGTATDVEPTRATIEGVVGPAGRETTAHFEYRETGAVSFQRVAAAPSPVAGTADTTVQAQLQGLQSGTRYDVRVIVENEIGRDTSETGSLLTPPAGLASPYKRTIRGNDGPGDAGWRMFAQPAAGATRAALEDDLNFEGRFSPILYRWTGTGWTAVDQSSDPLPRGEGFILYFFDDSTEPLDLDGIALDVPRGDEAPTADATVDGLSTNAPVHLLGNPYETAFDLDSLASGDLPGAGFQATVQVWNPNTRRYRQIVQGGDHTHVPAWQGFFVERSFVGQGATSLTFASGGILSMRGNLIGSQSPPPGLPPAPKARAAKASRTHAELHLQLEATDATGQAVASDRATLWMDDRAREGYDGYEARDLAPPGGRQYVTVAFPLRHRGQVVQRAQAARPFAAAQSGADAVPVSVHGVGVTGTARLSWPDSLRTHLPDDWAVTLIDTKTGTEVDLRTQDYTFPLGAQKALSDPDEARFRVAIESETLPVELTRFEGRTTAQGVELRWRTASETNNAGFRVLRRANQGDWVAVGSVDGAGTTAEPQTYRFADPQVPYAADSVSYRLKQIDTDGTAHLSDPVAVQVATAAPQLRAPYPNPARRHATVRFAVPADAQAHDATLRLYDMLGRQVRTVVAGRVEGRQERQLDVSGLSSGVYILQLRAGGTTRTQRLTVVR